MQRDLCLSVLVLLKSSVSISLAEFHWIEIMIKKFESDWLIMQVSLADDTISIVQTCVYLGRLRK